MGVGGVTIIDLHDERIIFLHRCIDEELRGGVIKCKPAIGNIWVFFQNTATFTSALQPLGKCTVICVILPVTGTTSCRVYPCRAGTAC